MATRIAGAAVATGGIALMGWGTIASPVASSSGIVYSSTSQNLNTHAPLLPIGIISSSAAAQTITSITESCSGGVTSGTLTVIDAVGGDTVTLGVWAHQDPKGDGLWHYTGAHKTITMVSGHSSYSFTISGVPVGYSDGPVSGAPGDDSNDTDADGDDYNSWRVQVVSVSGTFDGTTSKSASFDCSAPGTTTTSSTTSSKSTTTTSKTTSSTSSSTTSKTTTSSSSSSTTSKTTSSSSSSSTSSKSTTSSITTGTGGTTSSTTLTTSSSITTGTGAASTSTSTHTTGVQAATTPATGAGGTALFGVGLGLVIGGVTLLFGANPLVRRLRLRRKK